MTLPLDYSRCSPTACPLKSGCARWVDNCPPLPVAAWPQYVSMADFSVHLKPGKDGPECPHFKGRT